MVKRNKNIEKLKAGYLFPEINKKKLEFLAENPSARLINLGIGDTTVPISEHIAGALSFSAEQLSSSNGYSGYGPSEGHPELRKRIADKLYNGIVSADDVFISDGCKCDLGRLQIMLGSDVTIAVQDPAYPIYVDTSVIVGQTGESLGDSISYKGIHYLPCTAENNFFPNIDTIPKTDILFITSPNNPTGTVLDRNQLTDLVSFAKKNKTLIVYDSAYALFIRDQKIPKSIFEIDGADEVAIELGSFSKTAGFTGVRLGWCIVPEALKFDDGSSVKNDWKRIISTFFNGASNIAQSGGIAALDDEGIREMHGIIDYYLENAKLIKNALEDLGIETYGGVNAPYVWARFPGKSSWEMFDDLLRKAQLVTTPGSGFGPSGEEFVRFSAFGQRSDILEAMNRMKEYTKI